MCRDARDTISERVVNASFDVWVRGRFSDDRDVDGFAPRGQVRDDTRAAPEMKVRVATPASR